MSEVYLGLGTNLRNKRENIESVIELLENTAEIKVVEKAPNYKSAPVGPGDQSEYLNSVMKIKTTLSPHRLLEEVKNIEKKLGRKERPKWSPRIIDIDILFYNQKIIDTKSLKIPHPALHNRNFVLKPLMDIASGIKHPELKKTIAELWYENNKQS